MFLLSRSNFVLVKIFKGLICEFLFFGVKSWEFMKGINGGSREIVVLLRLKLRKMDIH